MKYFCLLLLIFFSIANLESMEEDLQSQTPMLTLRKLREEAEINHNEEGYLWALNYSPDNQLFAIADNKTIQIWDIKRKEIVHMLSSSKLPMSANFCSDNVHLISTGGPVFEGTDIQIWDVKTGKCIKTLEDYFLQSDANTCSLNGTFCLHADPESCPSLWNIEEKESIKKFKNTSGIFSLALSSDNQECAIGNFQKTISLYDVETQQAIKQITQNTAIINALGYTHNNKILVSGAQEGDAIKVWDLVSGKVIQTIQQDGSTIALTCSPDGKTVAYSQTADNKVHYFEINVNDEAQAFYLLY